MSKKVIIVGGVAGGASTAARLRRLDEAATIIMFEKGEYISFANCGLPYYIGGTITERNQLLVQTVEGMTNRFRIDIRPLSEVIKIDKENKIVTVKSHQTGEMYEESYDVLVLSPGAQPLKPNIPGINECSQLFTLRNIADTDQIKAYVDNQNSKHAVIIGGGFIGLEMAENLRERNIEVTVVEASNQVMAPLDFEMASMVHEHLIDKGVNLILNDGVKSFENQGHRVVLTSGQVIETDLIILSIGVRPETKIALEAGLTINERGAIVVDKGMKTSDESIYALGDAVEVMDYVSKQPTMIPLAWPANRQGRIVANNICGKHSEYEGTLGSSVAKIFDYTVATTGNNEKTLKRLGLEYQALHIHPSSHASYYPNAFPIAFKLLFHPTSGQIYGAQGVGMNGVEKRIDMIATAIKGNLNVLDLQDIEVCYAPPFNSAKDPVNMLGYYAENLMDGLVETIDWTEVDDLIEGNAFILDVRDEFEVALGSIKNSINIPLGQLRNRLEELPQNKTLYVTCQVGLRGYIACRLLLQHGFNAKNLDGGVKTYLAVKRAEQLIQSQSSKQMKQMITSSIEQIQIDVSINACGLQCPGPIRRVFEEMSSMEEGQILEVKASDPGFRKDISVWCEKTGNTLLKSEFNQQDKTIIAHLQKGGCYSPQLSTTDEVNCSLQTGIHPSGTELKATGTSGATLVVFSGDLDKAIASFIIATGAASIGKEVTMFFTFWGLNILKSKAKPKVSKDMMEKMLDFMLPNHLDQLPLSQMNMMGMGPAMIKQIMKKHNVDDLETLISNAINMGVKVVACSMSMELMGIKQEEFIEGVEIGGVASYLGAAEDSGLNLFI